KGQVSPTEFSGMIKSHRIWAIRCNGIHIDLWFYPFQCYDPIHSPGGLHRCPRQKRQIAVNLDTDFLARLTLCDVEWIVCSTNTDETGSDAIAIGDAIEHILIQKSTRLVFVDKTNDVISIVVEIRKAYIIGYNRSPIPS